MSATPLKSPNWSTNSIFIVLSYRIGRATFLLRNCIKKYCFDFFFSVAIDEKIKIPSWKSCDSSRRARWKLSIKDLREYNDMLAPYLLHEYGVEDFEDSSGGSEENSEIENKLFDNYNQSDGDAEEDEKNFEDIMLAISNSENEYVSTLDPISGPGNFEVE